MWNLGVEQLTPEGRSRNPWRHEFSKKARGLRNLVESVTVTFFIWDLPTNLLAWEWVGGWVCFAGVEKFLPGARPPHSRSEELKLSQDGVLDGLGILGGDPVAVVVWLVGRTKLDALKGSKKINKRKKKKKIRVKPEKGEGEDPLTRMW